MPRFKCPRCATIIDAADPTTLVCPNCGFPGTKVAQSTPQPSMSPPTPGYNPSPYPTMSPQYPTSAVPQGAPKNSGKAVASLVLGICSFIPWVGLITAPLAIVFASKARKDMRADPTLTGAGIATAGKILGIVGLVMFLVTVILAAVVYVLVSDIGSQLAARPFP